MSLLQYMKETRLDNPEIMVQDKRILRLDEIVREVKQSEEWNSAGFIENADIEREKSGAAVRLDCESGESSFSGGI